MPKIFLIDRVGHLAAMFVLLATVMVSIPGEIAHGQLPRILGGVETEDYPSVGVVGSRQRGGFCTGTLISSTHVLTAAHCAEVIGSATSGTFEVGGSIYETTDVIIHPDYDSEGLDADLAILVLSQSVPNIQPSSIARSEPFVDELLTIVGFGATGTPSDGSDGSFGTKRFGLTTIDEVSAFLVTWVFDDPAEMNTAPGDSGGPGFLTRDGQLVIASVTSGGTEQDASLGDVAFNTRVDAFADWIDMTVLLSEPMTDDPAEEPTTDDEPEQVDGCPTPSELYEHGPFALLRWLLELLWGFLSQWLDDTATVDQDSDTDESDTDQQTDQQMGESLVDESGESVTDPSGVLDGVEVAEEPPQQVLTANRGRDRQTRRNAGMSNRRRRGSVRPGR
ncbi:MAG: trypsin-like serine protease [Pirellulaceae bacterium]|nr:trypsin-like serine protease [Pirellulaceae bacterium]